MEPSLEVSMKKDLSMSWGMHGFVTRFRVRFSFDGRAGFDMLHIA